MAVPLGCENKPDRDPPEAAPAPVPQDAPAGVIAAVGDSLTEGYGVPEEAAYPALLEKKLRAAGHAFRVINAGISGETSSGTLSRIRWILTLNPDIVILETGANDGLRGIDPDLTRENIQKIVRILKGEGVVVVLAGMEMVRNLGADFTGAFREIYPSVAAAEDVLLIPFFLAGVAGDPRLNQADGIHPNTEGYRIIVETVYPQVIAAIDRLEAARRELSETP
jgi:acyl-CoA thioesterase-1